MTISSRIGSYQEQHPGLPGKKTNVVWTFVVLLSKSMEIVSVGQPKIFTTLDDTLGFCGSFSSVVVVVVVMIYEDDNNIGMRSEVTSDEIATTIISNQPKVFCVVFVLLRCHEILVTARRNENTCNATRTRTLLD